MNLVTHEALKARALVEISLKRKLNPVELTGPNLRRVGADARLVSGENYSLSRTWAEAIRAHPQTVDGICYPARTDPSQHSVAIFDRAQDALKTTSETRLESSAGLQRIQIEGYRPFRNLDLDVDSLQLFVGFNIDIAEFIVP